MVRIEILKASNWTRAKGDVVALSVGQVIEVPEAVASSMIAGRLAKPVPPPPVKTEAVDYTRQKKSQKFGGK